MPIQEILCHSFPQLDGTYTSVELLRCLLRNDVLIGEVINDITWYSCAHQFIIRPNQVEHSKRYYNPNNVIKKEYGTSPLTASLDLREIAKELVKLGIKIVITSDQKERVCKNVEEIDEHFPVQIKPCKH